jgi:two-component system chemotaxis sensor kinase CheA
VETEGKKVVPFLWGSSVEERLIDFGSQKITVRIEQGFSYLNIEFLPVGIILIIGYLITAQTHALAMNRIEIKRRNEIIVKQNENLEQTVKIRTRELEERNHEISTLLQNIEIGVFSIDTEHKIKQEYSKFVESIFETQQISGRDAPSFLCQFSDFFNTDDGHQALTAMDFILGEEPFAYETNSHCLPADFVAQVKGQQKYLELGWNPVSFEGRVKQLIVSIRDVTEFRELEQENRDQQRNIEILQQLIEVRPERFQEFYRNSSGMLEKVCTSISCESTFDVNQVYIKLHTIKGNARSLGLKKINEQAHLAEESLAAFRREDMAVGLASFANELQSLKEILDQYFQVNKNLLRRSDQTVNTNQDVLEKLVDACQNNNLERIKQILAQQMTFSLDSLKEDMRETLTSTAQQLQKPVPMFHVKHNIDIPKPYSDLIKSSLVHLIRNSLDHGIEMPEDRRKAGKPDKGNIYIAGYVEGNVLGVKVWDDGSGIDLNRIQQKSGLTGGENITDQQLADVVFSPSFSTADQVSDIPVTTNKRWNIWINPVLLQKVGYKLPSRLIRKARKTAH